MTRVTVELPCVTTSQVPTIHKRPLNIQNIKLFLVNGLTVGTPSKQLSPVMVQGLYETTFWGWKFYNFPLLLTSCKQPLDVWAELYSYVLLYVLCCFIDNMELHILYYFAIKMESTRKLSNFYFQWTKTLPKNNLKHIAFFFTFFKG